MAKLTKKCEKMRKKKQNRFAFNLFTDGSIF